MSKEVKNMFSEMIIDQIIENPLVKKYMNVNGEFTQKIYFFNAEGGYGKSTSFKSLYYYLVEQAAQANNHIVPIFIDVKQLVEFGEKGSAGNMPRPIEKYIVKNYCGEDSDPNESLLEKVINIFSKNNAFSLENHYTYFIFIDAINEVNDGLKQTIIDEIKQMVESDSVKFFISSRVNESSLPDDTVKYKLLPLDEEKIRVYLDKNFGKTGEKVDISKINDSLVDILRVPMYLSVFRKTYDERNPYPDIYEAKTVRKADILDSFIKKLLKDNMERARSDDKPLIEFVIKYFLPALAFLMVNKNGFIIDSDSTEKFNYDYFKKFFKGTKKETLKVLINSKAYNPLSICCKAFALLIENGDNFSFTHQNWRDLFAAKHIINCMNAEKLDELEITVSENIRQFVGELIREYKQSCGYSKDYMDKSDAEKVRKSECDFEGKDNIETCSESPIEHFLDKHNLNSIIPLSAIATKNLIEIMKTSRNNRIVAYYNNLDLSCTNFIKCNISNSKIYSKNLEYSLFISSGHTDVITDMAVTNSKRILVSASVDKTLKFWNTKTGALLNTLKLSDKSAPFSIAISNDDNYIVAGSTNGEIFIVDIIHFLIKEKINVSKIKISNEEWIEKISLYNEGIYSLCNSAIYFCNPKANFSICKITNAEIVKACFCGSKNICAFLNNENKLFIWKLSPSECLMAINTGDINVSNMLFSNDGENSYVFTSHTVYKTNIVNQTIETFYFEGLYGREFSLINGNSFINEDVFNNNIYLYEFGNPNPIMELPGHKDNIRKLCNLGNNRFYSGDYSGEIMMWNLNELNVSHEKLSPQKYSIHLLKENPINNETIFLGSDNTLSFVDNEHFRITKKTSQLSNKKIISFDYNEQLKMIAFSTNDKNIHCVNINNNKSVVELGNVLTSSHNSYFADSICFFNTVEALVSIGKNEGYIWNITNTALNEVTKLSNHTDYWIQKIKVSPNDRSIVCADVGGYIHSYEINNLLTFNYTERVVRTGLTEISEIYVDEKIIYVVSNSDNILKAYNDELELLFETNFGYNGIIISTDVAVYDKVIACVTNESIIYIMNLENGKLIKMPFKLNDQPDKIIAVTKNLIIIVGENSNIHYYDINNNREIEYQALQVNLNGLEIESAKINSSLQNDLFYNGANINKCNNYKSIEFCDCTKKINNNDAMLINDALALLQKEVWHKQNEMENEGRKNE